MNTQFSDVPGLGVKIDGEDAMACPGQVGRQGDGGSGFTCSALVVSKSINAHLGSLREGVPSGET